MAELKSVFQSSNQKKSVFQNQTSSSQKNQPEPKVSFWDILKEVPSATKKVLGTVSEFGKDIIRATPRAALSVGLSTPLGKKFEENGNRIINPSEFGIQKIIGDQPIESVGTTKNRYQNYLESKGIKGSSALASIGAVGGTTLDLLFGGGKTIKMAAKSISKETKNIENVMENLNHFKISDSIKRDIAHKLLEETDQNKIATALKSAEIVSKIERKSGVAVPSQMRNEIFKSLANTEFSDKNQAKKVINEVTDHIISQAPTRGDKGLFTGSTPGNKIPTDVEKDSVSSQIEVVKKLLDEKNIDDFGAIEDLSKLQEAVPKSKNLEDIKNQAQVIVDEIIQRRASKLRPEIAREIQNGKLFDSAKKSDNFNDFQVKIQKLGLNVEDFFRSKTDAEQFFKKSKMANNSYGVVFGLESDENGNLTFDPLKAGLGVLGVKSLGGIKGKVGLSKVGLAERAEKVTKTEKQLLKSQIKSESRVAKAVKKEDIKAIKRAMDSAGRQTKRVEKRAIQTANKAKKTGKKIGIFQQKRKDRRKIQQIYYEFKAKNNTIENLKAALRQYASDLPKDIQRKILSEKWAGKIKTGKNLKTYLSKVDRARQEFLGETKRLEVWRDVKQLNKVAREKGILQNANMRAKKELGIMSKDMLKRASEEKLTAYKKILQETLYPGKVAETKGIDWKKVEDVGSSEGKTTMQKVGEGVEKSLGVLSTNLRKVLGDKMFSRVREHRFDIAQGSKKAVDKMEGFQKAMRKLNRKLLGNKEDHREISYALFNRNMDRAKEIARKHGFEKEIDKIEELLTDIHTRANENSLKVGKLEGYFPRVVKDYEGLFKAYNAKFGKEGRSFLDKLLTDYANKNYKRVKDLSQEERADVLTKALRGYGQGKINIGSVGKARKFKELPVEFLKYYHSPEDALVIYASQMNEKISLKKLFGLEGKEQDSIGAMLEGFNLSPNELARGKEVLGAILSPHGAENVVLNKLRKGATLSILTNLSSTIFQVADIGLNAQRHGLIRAVASLFRKKPFKRDDMFMEIAHEFSDSNLIKKSLKAVGFDRLDRLNSDALMANSFREASRNAKKGKGSGFDSMKEYANVVFRGDEEKISKFINDVKSQNVTEETRLYIFNKVLDVQPRDLMEMPEAYVAHPNARVFYTMKSYALKVLDVYRNDVLREKKTWKKAKNFMTLTAYLTAAGATGSQLRDWYNGKETSFSDNVTNSLLQLMLLSTYDVNNIQQDGLGRTILQKGLPITRIVDDISKDIVTAGDNKGLTSIRNIPIIGNEIYNRFGAGQKKIQKQNEKSSAIQTKKPLGGKSYRTKPKTFTAKPKVTTKKK